MARAKRLLLGLISSNISMLLRPDLNPRTGNSGIGSSDFQKIVWAKTYSGGGIDRGLSVVAASDGGYLLVGIDEPMQIW